MLPVTATLLAAQRSASVSPHLSVRLFDREAGVPRLRFTRWYEGDEPDGPCAAAVPADGALLRARIDPSTGALSHQRVATPSATATFDAWTAGGTVAVTPRLGLGAAGTRALIATVAVDGVSIEVRESTDSGVTFGSPSTVATAASTATAVACAVRSDGSAAVTWAAGGVVYHVRRSGTGSWTSAAAWSRSLATVNALAMTDAEDYAVLVSGTDADGRAGVWSTRLGSGTGGPPGTWSPLEVVAFASPDTGITYLASGAAVAGAPRALLVESYDGVAAGAGAFDQVMLATAVAGAAWDAGAWREPEPFAHASAPASVHGLAAASRGVHAYLCAPGGVWHAEMAQGWTALDADVVEARYESRLEDGVPLERLRFVLRDGAGRYALGALPVLAPGGEVTWEPGATGTAGAEVATGRVLAITAVRRTVEAGRATVEVEAEGAWGRLGRWRAPSQRTWAAGEASVAEIAVALAQRAGVSLTVAGASATAVAHAPAFTLRAGESAATALARLVARTPDLLTARGWAFTLREPDGDDEPVEAYGETHAVSAASLVDGAPSEGWVRVLGDDVVGQAVDAASVARGGGPAVVVDRTLYAEAQAAARAEATLRRASLSAERAWLRAMPHVAQEPGDVVSLTVPALGLEASPFRVLAVRTEYARGPRARWEMHLSLGEV
ncbi:MAG: oxidoreductase [Chloroflexota bacterium]